MLNGKKIKCPDKLKYTKEVSQRRRRGEPEIHQRISSRSGHEDEHSKVEELSIVASQRLFRSAMAHRMWYNTWSYVSTTFFQYFPIFFFFIDVETGAMGFLWIRHVLKQHTDILLNFSHRMLNRHHYCIEPRSIFVWRLNNTKKNNLQNVPIITMPWSKAKNMLEKKVFSK